MNFISILDNQLYPFLWREDIMSVKKEHDASKKQTLYVGLGASASGVKALSAFFNSLPEETGMAFIVIVHPSPYHHSTMSKFLHTQTPQEIMKVNKTMHIEPQHVYV